MQALMEVPLEAVDEEELPLEVVPFSLLDEDEDDELPLLLGPGSSRFFPAVESLDFFFVLEAFSSEELPESGRGPGTEWF